MSHLYDVLAKKGGDVLTITPDASVLDAATRMNSHKVGALVVVEVDEVVGIITERDILSRLVAKRRDPSQMLVRQAMTAEVICGEPEMDVEDARRLFHSQRIRHLPVIDRQGQLRGMVSIGDLNAWELDGAHVTIRYLHEYLYGSR